MKFQGFGMLNRKPSPISPTLTDPTFCYRSRGFFRRFLDLEVVKAPPYQGFFIKGVQEGISNKHYTVLNAAISRSKSFIKIPIKLYIKDQQSTTRWYNHAHHAEHTIFVAHSSNHIQFICLDGMRYPQPDLQNQDSLYAQTRAVVAAGEDTKPSSTLFELEPDSGKKNGGTKKVMHDQWFS